MIEAMMGSYQVFTPHTRGWTLLSGIAFYVNNVYPAYAGMDPSPLRFAPVYVRLPRICGDGPTLDDSEISVLLFTPHMRGWTRRARRVPQTEAVYPAYAGMVLVHSEGEKADKSFPPA